MRQLTTLVVAAFALAATQALAQSKPMQPTAPGTPGDPAWQGVVRSDGRTFVTDGGLLIDAALARPDKLPEREIPARVLENYFKATLKDEYGFSDLKAAASGKSYSSPSGLALSSTYINFLRRVLPRSARFRMGERLQPIVILVDGKPVGAFMAMAQ